MKTTTDILTLVNIIDFLLLKHLYFTLVKLEIKNS